MLYFSHFRTTLVTIFSLCSTVCRHQQAEELMQEGKMALRNTSFSAFSSDCVNFQSNWFSSNYNKWYYWLVFVCDKKKKIVKTKNQAGKFPQIKKKKKYKRAQNDSPTWIQIGSCHRGWALKTLLNSFENITKPNILQSVPCKCQTLPLYNDHQPVGYYAKNLPR